VRRLGTEPSAAKPADGIALLPRQSSRVETLAYPDQLRGQLKLFGNRKRDAGLELGEHDAGHVDGIAEELGLT
jgi:hypothetical protein